MAIGNVAPDYLNQILKIRKSHVRYMKDEISEIEKLIERGMPSSKRINIGFSENEFPVIKALLSGKCKNCRELAEKAFGKEKAQDMANTTTNTFNFAKNAVKKMSAVFERLKVDGVVEIEQVESLGLPDDQVEFYKGLVSYDITLYQNLVDSLRKHRGGVEENPTWMSL